MIRYKEGLNILDALKQNGYSTYRLRKEHLLGEATLTLIRKGELVSYENLSRLCAMLQCQPGDLMEYVPDKEASNIVGRQKDA